MLSEQQRVQFAFPESAKYSNGKYRNNYLISSGDDGIVRIWFFDKIKEDFFLFGEYGEKQKKEAQFDLSDKYLFYSKDKLLIVYDIFSKNIIIKKEFLQIIKAIDFQNNKIIVYSGNVSTFYIIKNNELFSDEEIPFIELPDKYNFIKINDKYNVTIFKNSVLFSEKNKRNENTEQITITNLKTLSTDSDYIFAVAINSDTKNIIFGSRNNLIKIFNFDGKYLQVLTGHKNSVLSFIITPDGKNIVSGSADNTIKIWDFNGNCLNTLLGHKKYITSVAVTSDGKNIISGSADDTIKIWDFNGNCLNTLLGHTYCVLCLTITPDGKNIVSGSVDNTIKVWDSNGNCLNTLIGHKNEVYSLAITPDGKNIISGSSDNTIKIWDFNGNCLKTLEEHAAAVYSIAITSDGKNIISGSDDCTIKIWDFNGNCLKTLISHKKAISSVLITSDGKNIVSGSGDNTIKIWEINTEEIHKSFNIKEALSLSDLKSISLNLVLPIYGIKKFNNYLIIYYKNGNEICFNDKGEFVFKTITENVKYINLQQSKINFYPLENDYIVEKDGFYYGSKNYKDYLYFINDGKICLNNEGYETDFNSVENKNLFEEI